ncbi:MAG: MBOAT family protein [Actinomycetota bacterium]|nr:MBOAT family protein [Actinomycetota bacterium]
MVFNSVQFAIFLSVVWFAYWRLSSRRQLMLLVAGSYFFYGYWDWRFLSLLAISTIVDFHVAGRMKVASSDTVKRRLLWVSMCTNLGILGAFKYFNFFVDSAQSVLETVGLATDPVVLRVVLPVGISFYTFQTMSYTIDVYRGRIEPTDDLLTFAVYVSYFPQLVAGPIERATRLLPQLQRERLRPTADRLSSGLTLIVLGLFKKVVIGDLMAVYVDQAFGRADTQGSVRLIIGLYAFAFQIYADFSGYSDIARGTSRLFGIELIRNFEQPYLSRSITEFWRRWHISLSDWLRDYLYIPLGGNRGGTIRTYRNLAATMLLGGLWHGASWAFVVWGALHGIFLVIERLTRTGGDPDAPLTWRQLPRIIFTFHLACLAWVFFRAPDFATAMDYLTAILSLRSGLPSLDQLLLMGFLVPIMIAIDLRQRYAGRHDAVVPRNPLTQGVLFGAAAVLVILASGGAKVPFIYFQF